MPFNVGVHARRAALPVLILGAASAPRLPETNLRLSPVANLELPAPLDDMLKTPGTFRAFANAVKPRASQIETVAESDASRCDASQSASTITMTALDRSNKIAHKHDYRFAQRSHSYVLARIEVTGCDFVEYNIPRGHRAYWIVEPDANLILVTRLVDVGLSSQQTGTGLPAESAIDPGHVLAFSECPQQHVIGVDLADVQPRDNVCRAHDDIGVAESQALFGAKRATVRIGGTVAAYLVPAIRKPRSARKRYDASDPLLWIICSDGCCYAESL